MNYHNLLFYILILFILSSCKEKENQFHQTNLPSNILDYSSAPTSPQYRESLAFSDQGAWFAYGFQTSPEYYGGYSGPFLMTQENGVWCSPVLCQLKLKDINSGKMIDWEKFTVTQSSFNSHLQQVCENERLKITQTLFFLSPHSALINTKIENISNHLIRIQPGWHGTLFLENLSIIEKDNDIKIISKKSTAKGFIKVLNDNVKDVTVTDSTYQLYLDEFEISPGESNDLLLSNTFIFPEYNISKEIQILESVADEFYTQLHNRIRDKEKQLKLLYQKIDKKWNKDIYKKLVAKTVLTLQNNWRIPAGELKHSGLFPSYHYIWFHGFWAWDSWKHAVALSYYDTQLAKEQIRAMYDFMAENGFIADCVYRDTTIENHNYRNTKPPLSSWAVWNVYQQDKNIEFLKEIYPKLIKQHNWWYSYRDYDKDGLCEYGSTDGTLIAAKWESGMDNAVRFDDSKILRTSDTAYSLNQESVDLNSYLFVEKIFLMKMSQELTEDENIVRFKKESEELKIKIQQQFFDSESGWFYDTSIDGNSFIKVMGCEGWIPLWANVATEEQAEAVKRNMMNPEYFYTKVPFQTLTANHLEFEPDGGYWRGPNWLDQASFGVKGLQNYGYFQEADSAKYRLLHNAGAVLELGKSIRENYNPITGAGLESENFSWSAAHYLLLLMKD